VFFCGVEKAQKKRCYLTKMSGGAPTPVTPAGVSSGSPARDGRSILTRSADDTLQVVDLATGSARTVTGGLRKFEKVVGWSRDSRSVFVLGSNAVPASIERLDLATGARTRVRELMPSDRSGVMMVLPGRVYDDAYAYTYWRQVNRPVVVTGAAQGK
jgi:hypothetical protein